MSYWEKEDGIFLIAFFIVSIGASFLAITKIIPVQYIALTFIIIFLSALSRPIILQRLSQANAKNLNKGIEDFWNAIREEILNTSHEYKFHYKIKMPPEYMPRKQIELLELKLSLHEINKNEMTEHGTDYWETNETPKQITIIYSTQKEKIIGMRTESLEETLEFIKENRDLYSPESLLAFRPEFIKETSFGQAVQVKRQ